MRRFRRNKLTVGQMSVTLDKEGCAYVELQPIKKGGVFRTLVVHELVIFDYDHDDKLIGVEVIGRP